MNPIPAALRTLSFFVSPFPMISRRAAVGVLFIGLPLMGGEIPDRPEKLQFPPLKYEVPNAADYRVKLQSGPVAYVVPDRELPLVNISILVRTGDYVVPPGKEGLADLCGYLLTKGGIRSKTA
jgi:hypothetical protein